MFGAQVFAEKKALKPPLVVGSTAANVSTSSLDGPLDTGQCIQRSRLIMHRISELLLGKLFTLILCAN